MSHTLSGIQVHLDIPWLRHIAGGQATNEFLPQDMATRLQKQIYDEPERQDLSCHVFKALHKKG